MYKIKICISQCPSIPDPTKSKVETALHGLGYTDVKSLTVGKIIAFDIDTDSAESAKAQAKEMCQKLLANEVSETYCIEVVDCPCARAECENYQNCYTCVASHRQRGYLPACFRTEEAH